jgi:hypothetical protein
MVCGVLNVASKVIVSPSAAQAMASRSELAPESLVLVTTVHGPEDAAVGCGGMDSPKIKATRNSAAHRERTTGALK